MVVAAPPNQDLWVVKLHKLIAAFEARQNKYADLGANDAEPDGVFHGLIMRTLLNEKPKDAPRTAEDWQLYSDMRGASAAARSLGAHAQAILTAIKKIPHGEIGPARTFLTGYCWRW
jgi:hypothetical protein